MNVRNTAQQPALQVSEQIALKTNWRGCTFWKFQLNQRQPRREECGGAPGAWGVGFHCLPSEQLGFLP